MLLRVSSCAGKAGTDYLLAPGIVDFSSDGHNAVQYSVATKWGSLMQRL